MTEEILRQATELRARLHACAEISGHETRTRALLEDTLRRTTSLELQPCGRGFYAVHREGAAQSSIALRADYDALAIPGGGAAHLCGHDGHAAALYGVALLLEGRTIGRNVFLLFQPEEEVGSGAESCCELFEKEHIDEIYGMHNLPGLPLGRVTTRPGTFACASRGVILRLIGRPTHAAYPENGISPAPAVGRLLCATERIADPKDYTGMTLCTVIGAELGEKAFGAAAERAEVWLTLRAEHDADLERLHERVLSEAESLARTYRLDLEQAVQDVFPATENDPGCAERVLARCEGTLLPEPMRWSEDFGHYLQRVRGAFLGIGAGEDCPALHTERYEYPDALLPYAIEAFMRIVGE